jgi:hypothetical protein
MGRGVRNCQLVYRVNGAKMCVIAIHILQGWGGGLPTPMRLRLLPDANRYQLQLRLHSSIQLNMQVRISQEYH